MRYKESLKMSKEAGYLSAAGNGALRGAANGMVIGLGAGSIASGVEGAHHHITGVRKFKARRVLDDAMNVSGFLGLAGGAIGAYKGVIGEYKKNRERKHGNLDRYNGGDIDSARPK